MDALPHKDEEELKKAERIAYLIAGHLQDNLSPAEREELDDWVSDSDENLALFEKLTDEDHLDAEMLRYRQIEQGRGESLESIKRQLGLRPAKSWLYVLAPWMLTAAFLMVVISIYLLVTNTPAADAGKPVAVQPVQAKSRPSQDQAVLILGDGRTVILDVANTGLVTEEGPATVTQNHDGTLQYKGEGATTAFHTLVVPRGKEYQLLLSDGTKVWLNAESSIRYPVTFNSEARQVELMGEAYFEVAHQPERPFEVTVMKGNASSGTVTVLGTTFNINAYESEDLVRTTLLEGAVQVARNGVSKLLRPGEQAQLGSSINITRVNVQEQIAWQQGKFLFRDATIQSIGEQIRRWYDVDIEYKGIVSHHFNAEVDRHEPLSRLLQILEGTGQVHFQLEGKKLHIQP